MYKIIYVHVQHNFFLVFGFFVFFLNLIILHILIYSKFFYKKYKNNFFYYDILKYLKREFLKCRCINTKPNYLYIFAEQ